MNMFIVTYRDANDIEPIHKVVCSFRATAQNTVSTNCPQSMDSQILTNFARLYIDSTVHEMWATHIVVIWNLTNYGQSCTCT